jgi:hypothetical protein
MPQISKLQYAPASAFVGTGQASVVGTVQFSDPGGDLASLSLTTSAGATQAISLQGASGQTSGTLQGSFLIDTSQLGHFTFNVSVTDSKGNVSNALNGTFDVVIDDVAQAWTPRSTGITPQLDKIIWTGSQFVVVGYSGTILTSSDGITWTSRASGTAADLTGVAWTGTRLVAVGNDQSAVVAGISLTSSDGVAWAVSSTPLPVAQGVLMTDVAWSGSQLVAVGYNADTSGGVILTSPDGLTWTAVSSPADALDVVTWNGNQFLAGGNLSGAPALLRSVDGMLWTADAISAGSGGIVDLINAGTGTSSTEVGIGGSLWVDRAGAGWQTATNPLNLSSAIGAGLAAVGWSGSHFLACSGLTNACALSANGLQWNTTAGAPALSMRSLVWGGPGYGRWVAVGFAGQIATSP